MLLCLWLAQLLNDSHVWHVPSSLIWWRVGREYALQQTSLGKGIQLSLDGFQSVQLKVVIMTSGHGHPETANKVLEWFFLSLKCAHVDIWIIGHTSWRFYFTSEDHTWTWYKSNRPLKDLMILYMKRKESSIVSWFMLMKKYLLGITVLII